MKQSEPGVGVTNLTVNYLHCGAEQTLPPSSVTDWMQCRYPLRLPVDRVGTVDRLVFQRLLATSASPKPTSNGGAGRSSPP